MRTLVDIPDQDLAALDRLSARRRVSRAKVIRQAVSEFLTKSRGGEAEAAFGLWRDAPIDGLEYQDRARSEW
jgi:metal-responsive CopG/Arc/MetJ family transcriptional regulator